MVKANRKVDEIVYVVDDDEAVRQSLGFLLRSVGLEPRLYANGNDFLAEWDGQNSGCVVLDVRMPGLSGLEVQRELNSRSCALPILFITGHGDIPMAVEALKAGAIDFLQKPFRDQELLDCIHQALDRNREERHFHEDRAQILECINSLTPREKEVMDYVTAGKANKVIALDLGISQRTVEIHRANVMEKMRARSLASLVRSLHQARYFDSDGIAHQ